MSSFFEISGEIIECLDEDTPFRIQSLLESAAEEVIGSRVDRMMGIPNQRKPAASVAEGETGFTPKEVGQSLGRLRRATTAATWAGTLALADGPLPFGDALAAGVLTGYAVYELSLIYRDYRD